MAQIFKVLNALGHLTPQRPSSFAPIPSFREINPTKLTRELFLLFGLKFSKLGFFEHRETRTYNV